MAPKFGIIKNSKSRTSEAKTLRRSPNATEGQLRSFDALCSSFVGENAAQCLKSRKSTYILPEITPWLACLIRPRHVWFLKTCAINIPQVSKAT